MEVSIVEKAYEESGKELLITIGESLAGLWEGLL